MSFIHHGVEEHNQLYSLKKKELKIYGSYLGKKIRKLFSNFVFFLNAVDLWFQAMFRENPRFT